MPPRSRYELMAGAVIPAALITELNSEQPGRAIAQVTATVERLRELSPLWDMHQAGIDLASIQWSAH